MSRRYPGISDPGTTLEGALETIRQLKKVVEIITRQVGPRPRTIGAVTWQDLIDLVIIEEQQVPEEE